MSNSIQSQIERTKEVKFEFDGEEVQGFDGESIAVALLRAERIYLRDAPNSKTPRGMFCNMGICQECVVEIDGRKKEACRTSVSDGLIVKRVVNV